jgi:hypothetical protein
VKNGIVIPFHLATEKNFYGTVVVASDTSDDFT